MGIEEKDIKLHQSWISQGNTLFLESMKGYYDTSRWGRDKDFEDRRFMLRINDGDRFAFSHEMQLALIQSVLENDALPHRFIQNCEKFLNRIYEVKGKRKALEREKYNVKISDYMDKKLWNCGGKNESS